MVQYGIKEVNSVNIRKKEIQVLFTDDNCVYIKCKFYILYMIQS